MFSVGEKKKQIKKDKPRAIGRKQAKRMTDFVFACVWVWVGNTVWQRRQGDTHTLGFDTSPDKEKWSRGDREEKDTSDTKDQQ